MGQKPASRQLEELEPRMLLSIGGLSSNTATVTTDVSDTLPPLPASVAAQFNVNHHPRLQLGDAPLDGYAGSGLDQIAILWQTESAGTGTQDSFTVEYRTVGTGNAWQSSDAILTTDTGSGTRVVHEVEITGLNWNSDYEYRVRHLRAGELVEEFADTFRTRLQAGDTSNFRFVAYGDSARRGANDGAGANDGFRSVQDRINIINPAFSVLLGDNVYDSGSHAESDARFDPAMNPEAAEWMASHIDYLGLGNHDVRTGSGSPSEMNFAVPVPTAGVDSLVAPPSSERDEHNFSWDYGDVHFVTFDTNSWNNPTRRDALLDYVIADLDASDARWKIVYGHHPIAAAPDKAGEWDSPSGRAYYDEVVDRFTAAGVDLFLAGHSHTFSWTRPLTGRDAGGNITYESDDYDTFVTETGLPQVISGTGGKNLRTGSHATRPYVGAAWTADETVIDGVVNSTSQRAEDGFAQIDVTQDVLTVSYVAADDGAVLGSFSISQAQDTTGPKAELAVPIDNGASDLNSTVGEVLVNQTQPAIDIQLHDSTAIDEATVTTAAVAVTRNGSALTAGTDYSFRFDAASDQITLRSLGGEFGDGTYVITLGGGATTIADTLGNAMMSQTLSFEIDTTISLSGGDRGTGSTSGSLEATGDRDVFSVAVADGRMRIDLNGINGLDTYLRVYDAVGTQIASNDDGGPGLSSVVTINVTAGTYYISVGSYADMYAGDFTLDVAHRAHGTSSFRQGVDGYSDSSDTFLSGDSPNQGFGGGAVNEIDLSSSGNHEHSLLQFANIFGSGTGQIPSGSEITSATLTVYVTNGGNQIDLHRMLAGWDDAATWDSFRAGIQADGVEAGSSVDAQTAIYTPTGWNDVDVTASLIAWAADPTSNHGWAMLPTGTNGVDFYSTNNVSDLVPGIRVDYLAPAGDLRADAPGG